MTTDTLVLNALTDINNSIQSVIYVLLVICFILGVSYAVSN